MAQLLRTPDVARKLGLSVERFYRQRQALDREGFPAPCAPFKTRWSADAVDAWINRTSPVSTPAAANQAGRAVEEVPADDDLAAWSRKLSERARAASQ